MKPATNSLAKKKHAIPHVYIILLIVILLATVLTYADLYRPRRSI